MSIDNHNKRRSCFGIIGSVPDGLIHNLPERKAAWGLYYFTGAGATLPLSGTGADGSARTGTRADGFARSGTSADGFARTGSRTDSSAYTGILTDSGARTGTVGGG